jgi:hypothetical protein
VTQKTKFGRSFLKGSTAFSAVAMLGAGLAGSMIVAAPAAAQDVTAGSINGTVVNAQGAPVSGATVTLQSERGVTRTVTTSATGSFFVPQLPVGTYDITIAAPGLTTVRNEDVQVSLGGTAYTFEVGGASDADASAGSEIVVTGTRRATVDFSGTATGVVFDVQEVAERVPVPRTIEAIQLLAPQTTSGDVAFGGVSIGGSSVAENIFYINGMNITNFRTFVGGTTVPFEFYDQVQVKTGGYQAEFGRNTGGAVIALTRSGSNEFKGGINVFWNPSQLRSEAPNTFGQNNALDRRQNYEGNVWASGPIIPNRLFFFGFFNPRYASTTDTARSENTDASGKPLGTFTNTTRTFSKIDEPFYGGKLDLNLFDGHRLEATYFSDNQDQQITQRQAGAADSSNTTNFSGGENMIFRYTGTFTDWFTLSALYGRSKFNQTSQGSQDLQPAVIDGRSGTLIQLSGNPNLVIESGRDRRDNYRVDADFYFNMFGDHHLRIGADREYLKAEATTEYSGGVYYRFYRAGANGATVAGGKVPAFTDYVRIRNLQSGGNFESENTAFYIQDSWDVTERLNLSLGVRNDRFINRNAEEVAFTDLKNQWAPRVGFNFDPFGDKRTRISGFYGRYYLPVAANTNIRLAGEELFTQDFFLLNATNYTGSLTNPVLGAKLGTEILSPGGVSQASTLVSQNLKPQYLDEFILGGEHRFGDRWSVGLNLTYRTLGAVLEDADLDYTITAFCNTQNVPGCRPGQTPAVLGSGGYVLLNPGSDAIIDIDLLGNGTLTRFTIPASVLDLPKAKRKYYAAEFKFDRAFDGVWGLSGSYVLADSRGNYEGGVKSDNGQDDTGLTQDFDEPGWMDGSFGYLPNHRRHTFKLYGAYQVLPSFRVGFNALLQSPRKFGCQGTYPFNDGRAVTTLASSWYCKAQVQAGNVTQLESGRQFLVGRGRVFDSDWNKRVDLSFAYTTPIAGLRDFTVRADVFNVFNFKSKLDFNEFGDLDNADVINPNYRKVTTFQTPRFVRLSASINF